MSAPQRASQPKSSAPRGPRLVGRPRAYHHGRTRAEFLKSVARSRWAYKRILSKAFEVTPCGSHAAWILFVAGKTFDSDNPKERRAEWSAPIYPEDAAVEYGYSPQEMRAARNWNAEQGLVPRNPGNFYSFKVDWKAVERAPRAFKTREGAFVGKGPALAEGPESASISTPESNRSCGRPYAKSDDAAIAPEPLTLAVPPEPVVLPAETGSQVLELTVPSPREVRVECRNRTSLPITIASSISDSGALCIDLLPFVQAAAAPGPPEIFVSAPGWREFSREVLSLTGLPLDEKTASDLSRKLRPPLDFYAAVAGDRVARAKLKGEHVTSKVVGFTVANANERWEALGPEGRAEWVKPKSAAEAQLPLIESYVERRAREIREEHAKERGE